MSCHFHKNNPSTPNQDTFLLQAEAVAGIQHDVIETVQHFIHPVLQEVHDRRVEAKHVLKTTGNNGHENKKGSPLNMWRLEAGGILTNP